MTARKRVEEAGGRFEIYRAPFALRCGAMLVDYTILVSMIAFATLLARLFGGGARLAGNTALALGYLAAAAASVLNFVVLSGLTGRTLGKWVTGLHIEERSGAPLSFGRAALRHLLGYPLSLITLGIGFLVAAFDSEGRALHDRIAGTIVVRDRSRARRSRGSSSSDVTAAR